MRTPHVRRLFSCLFPVRLQAYEQWAEPLPGEAPTPTVQALTRLRRFIEEDLGVSVWLLAETTLIAVAILLVIRGVLYPWWRHYHSNRAAEDLLRDADTEERLNAAAKKERQTEEDTQAGTKPLPADAAKQRVCRFCDQDVDEKYVASHVRGKKHTKAVGARAGTPAADDCWRFETRRVKKKAVGPDESRFVKVNGEVFDTALM